jgi:HTTM domain
METWRERILQFLFPAESDTWLAALRLGLGFQVMSYAVSLQNDWTYLLTGTGDGLIGRTLGEAILSLESPIVPRLGWLVTLGAYFGVREETVLSIVWICLFGAGCFLLVGFLCRSAAILAWLLHLCATTSAGMLSYGVDNFMTIGLFYLLLSPLPDRYSLDHRWRKRPLKDPQLLGFFRRVLQVHLCLIYFFSGLTKCLGSGWWNGSNIWRALVSPPSNIIAPELLVKLQYVLPVAGIFICILETGYPFLIWGRRTRSIWLTCICGMHIAIGLTMGLYLFALIMIVLNVAAFGPNFAFHQIQSAPQPRAGNCDD